MNPLNAWLKESIGSAFPLAMLNTITKYPSIPTYHAIGEKGRLTDTLNIDFGGAPIEVTEKIDGTNVRVIHTQAGYFLGSRENLLYAEGDLIGDPAMGIVNHAQEFAEGTKQLFSPDYASKIVVIWGELYGGRVTANSKQYTGTERYGFRVFDVARLDLVTLSGVSQSELSVRRERGELMDFHSDLSQLPLLKLVPSLGTVPNLPTGLGDTHEWLKRMVPKSIAHLDDSAGGLPEGVVVRNADRSKIAKIRFEDYARTLKAKGERK